MRAVLSSVKVQIVFEKYVGLNPPPPSEGATGPLPLLARRAKREGDPVFSGLPGPASPPPLLCLGLQGNLPGPQALSTGSLRLQETACGREGPRNCQCLRGPFQKGGWGC